MLRFLSIRNLAVIDRLELEFEPGLNVLTGETGAGKSILVGAVGLLVGGRASAELVRTGEDQAAVEAVFEDAAGAELMVRREVSAQSGRSRAFLNGSLATSAALREAAAQLVDLHGQHEHQLLLDPATHLDLLDAFAGLDGGAGHGERRRSPGWQSLRAERDRLAIDDREKARRAEFLAVPAHRDPSAPRLSRAKTTSSRGAAGARPTPNGCSGCAPRRTRRCTRETRAALPALVGGLEEASASSRRSIRSSAATSPPREPSSRSSRISRISCARIRGNRRFAGAPAGGRGPPRGARTPEEEARADARRT